MAEISPRYKPDAAIFERVSFFLWRELPLPRKVKQTILYLINFKFPVGVVAIIENEKGEILLFKHSYYKDHEWSLPAGIAKQERLTEAMTREIAEESGFKIDSPHLIGVVQEGRQLKHIFRCKVLTNNFRPSEEVSSYKFVSSIDLNEVGLSSQKILKEFYKNGNHTEGISDNNLRLIDFSLIKPHNETMVEKKLGEQRMEIDTKDLGKKKRETGRVVTRSGHVFYIIDDTSEPVIPPPPFAFENPASATPDWIPNTDQHKTSLPDS